MLIRFSVENFRSFKTKQEFSMVASTATDFAPGIIQVPNLQPGLLRAASIYGANASGKTNVLKALAGMSTAVRISYRRLKPEGRIPTNPFSLDSESAKQPSAFEADIIAEGVRYTYGFRLDSKRILDEWLYLFRGNRRTVLFQRDSGSRSPFTFGRSLSGPNHSIREITRPNSLFLSAAAQGNHEMLRPVYRWFENLPIVIGDREMLEPETATSCAEEDTKATISRMLSTADLGVTGLNIEEEVLDEKAAEREAKLFEAIRTILEGAEIPDKRGRRTVVSLVHRADAGKTVKFPLREESDGTRTFFYLLGPIVRALRDGSTLCIDELDASLHPLLAVEIIRLFNDPSGNVNNAQLIFTTQDTNLLDAGILRRDQVWFTEKDDEGQSHLYPLTDYKPRKSENLARGYLQGRYGAVPFLGSFAH
jgi:AAA15 family ATPase/GTPase